MNYPVELEELTRLINKVIGREVHEVKLWDWEEAVRMLTELYNDIVGL